MVSYYAAFGDRLPLWAEIDEAWYFEQKPNLREEILAQGFTDLSLYHEAVGAAAGLSPNPYFDEAWYRAKYPEVREAIKEGVFSSGFEHYCQEGFRIRSPHWLFSEEQYRWSYAGYDDAWLEAHGYPNGYAHFLNNKISLTLTGSPFFDPFVTRAWFQAQSSADQAGRHPYLNALNPLTSLEGEPRLSWFFDPDWYLARYPEAAQAVAEEHFQSALHHYLTNDTPERFDPLPHFSESAYRQAYPDVVPALGGGIFRSAYEHFLRHGAYEGRRPNAEIDLGPWIERFRQLGPMADREADHPFRQWMRAHFAPVGETHAAVELDERETRPLFLEEARQCADIALRGRLDFTCHGEPDISVILVMRNQFALTMQALASLRANYDGPIEVIIVDSGSSDLSGQIENHVDGLHVMRFPYNIGFLLGANEALPRVRSPYCLYLNNDIRLFPNAVANALHRLQSSDDIGAVGAKIIRSHMRLQEAGSIICRDGASYGYRRQDDPNIGEANFVRDVDYCSAAFLMVRTEDARHLGGFDPKFAPAYFEDTDFCLRMLKSGKRIVYDPSVAVEHMESGSFGLTDSHDWIQINHRVFFNRHRQLLLAKPPPHVRNAVLGREQKRGRETVLVIEDRLPVRRLGSGYVRSNEVVRAMSALGYQVSVFPMMDKANDPADLVHDFPDDVELLTDWHLDRFTSFIEERAGYYDILWICRTHNLSRLLPIVTEHGRYLPMKRVILDTEVIDTPRRFEKARILGAPKIKESMAELIGEELASSHFCQQIVAVSADEARMVREAGYEHVSILGHALEPDPTQRPFQERHHFLFVGALYAEDTPNYDSLKWLIEEVFPHLHAMIDDPPLLTIAGYIDPDLDIKSWRELPHVRCVGPVRDLKALYDSHRVFVAPTRYAGGLPYKVHEAASFGIPIVATDLLARQVNWKNDVALLCATAGDPRAFARQMVSLYYDAEIWHRVRLEALAAVTNDCDPNDFKARVEEILTRSLAISQI